MNNIYLTVHDRVSFYFRCYCVLIPASPDDMMYMQRQREMTFSSLSRGVFVSGSTDLSCKFDSVPFNFILALGLTLIFEGCLH